ncbi:GNAT family N-acetyltransferase [Ornithinibacillus salinisoli]|uniref:GNAT family N-acetyltransferase n=1 Tax=Ornithinibacillus salinisoli TaxID=1848459 RepID=A0ABW4W774_9BACI
MYELKQTKFNICKQLLSDADMVNEVQAIIAGKNPGRIFVDDSEEPKSGLVWFGNLDGFCFIGDENNDVFIDKIDDLIDQVIAPESKALDLKWFEGFGINKAWEKKLETIFAKRKPVVGKQRVYTLFPNLYVREVEPIMDSKYSMEKITKLLLENNKLKNKDKLQSKVLEFWQTIDDFETNGLGYCIVYKNEIVSHCFSSFTTEKYQGIAIETEKEYRGKNLAKIVAHRFVQECFNNRMIPYWDCMEINKPSIAVAESIGFQRKFNYKVMEFPFEN